MMKHLTVISHALVLLVAVLTTSGIWIGSYFLFRNINNNNSNNPNNTTNGTTVYNINGSVTYNLCDSSDSSSTQINCPTIPPYQCTDTCEIVICESIPAGLQFDNKYPIFNKTTDCWLRLLNEAQYNVTIASYYWSLLVQDTGDNYTTDPTNTSLDGKKIYDAILSTSKRVDFRIAQTYQANGYPETINLAKDSNGRIQVRSLDFTHWYPGGILHTKSWAVDGKHIYIGSANFDWRSLTQVKELGIAAFNCPCLGQDLSNLLEIYWQMGAPGAKLPTKWPTELATPAKHETPTLVPQSYGNQAFYITASPPGFRACGREDDLAAMIKILDEAKEFANLAVMDYAPTTLYLPNNLWLPELDNAIRRAAFERQVHVKFLLSRWTHTYKEFYAYMHSLASLNATLPCKYTNGHCAGYGIIDVRFIQVPTTGYEKIPYARVYHNKYFVTESTAYVGTSNWSPDYWKFTAGIGVVVRSDDQSQVSPLVKQLNSIFERDWNSGYTIPLSYFDDKGGWTNHTTTTPAPKTTTPAK